MNSTDVVILGMGRTPRGRFGGTLRDMDADDLSAAIVPEILNRSGVKPDQVDLVLWGQTRQAGYGGNPARPVSTKSGIPIEVPSFTVNMTCISAMQALISGIQAIQVGDAEIVLAGGMEVMSGLNYILKGARWGFRSGHKEIIDDGYIPCRSSGLGMGMTAENVAAQLQISREDQDKFAYESHLKAIKAQDEGWFDEEMIPIKVPQKRGEGKLFATDECIRRDIDFDKMAGLPPAFKKDGTVTAGNSCPLTDGANGIVLASRAKAEKLGLKPLASFVSYHTIGVDPAYMGLGPTKAVPVALEKAGLKLGQIDLTEFNEAFACVVLAGIRILDLDVNKLNIHGGAISLGHPTGSTGSRLVVTLYHALKRTGGQYGMATLCAGGGLGGAVIIKME
ncbi:MAG: thiolase family protein [Thermodesulfobacteriota bacterium]|nr:thiolase family protein [Thermodesulfobacteriota bacterium]